MRLLGLLALIAGLLVAGAILWLHTAMSRAWVERQLVQEVNQRWALTLTVGRTSGNPLRDIRYEQVAVHDAEGRLVARADAVSAHFRLDRLIFRHEINELAIVRPVIVRVPTVVVPPGPSPGEPTTIRIRALRISDGSIHIREHGVERLSANLDLYSGKSGAGAEGEVRITLDNQRLILRSKFEQDARGLRVAAKLDGAAFSAHGEGSWADGRLDARIVALDLDPKLLARARPLTGRGVLHARGTVVGSVEALEVKLHGHSDDRGLALGAIVDVPRQSARLSAFVATPMRSAGLHARAALHGDALEVSDLEAHTGATRLAGNVQVKPGALEATLRAHVNPAEASLVGIQPAAPIQVRAALHGPVRALDVRLDGRLRAAKLALTGRIDLPARRARVHFVAREIRPSEIVPKAPELVVSGAFTFDGALRRDVGLTGDMSLTDGSLWVGGWSFDQLKGVGRVRLGQPGEAQVETLSGRLRAQRPQPISVEKTAIRWDGHTLRFDVTQAFLEENRAAVEIVYGHAPATDRPYLEIQAKSLVLSAALIEEATRFRPVTAWPGEASLVWTPDDAYALRFAFDTEQGLLEGAARLRREGDVVDASGVTLALGESRFRGAVRLMPGELVAAIDELILPPSLFHPIWPTVESARTMRVQGAVAGTRHALDFHLIVTAGASTAKLRGRIDLPARSFRLVAAFDNFYLQAIEETRSSRFNLELSLAGQLVEGGMKGNLLIRHVWGTIKGLPLDAARLDAKLDGPRFDLKAVLGVPGAIIDGKGGGTYDDFKIRYGVVIIDSERLKQVPQFLRVMVGLTTLTPGRSVYGSVKRHGGGNIELTHHSIPPVFRFANLLYRLILGHPPVLKVD